MSIKTGAATPPFNLFELMIARRYLGATRSGKGVSLISIIAFGGIALAVFVLIVVMSVMQGFRAKLLEQMLGLNGHVFVQMQNSTETADELIDKIRTVSGVTNVAPLIQAPVYATTPFGEEAVLVRAMRREDILALGSISGEKQIEDGSFEKFGVGKNGGSQIAIGTRLASALGVQGWGRCYADHWRWVGNRLWGPAHALKNLHRRRHFRRR